MLHKFVVTTAMLALPISSALAADFPARLAPPPNPPIPLFTWSGFYLGAQVGYANIRDSANVIGTGNTNGLAGGAHVGYNYQLSQIVFGAEADVDAATNRVDPVFGGIFYGTNTPIQGSTRGRLGFSWDRTLIYATGGAAFADFERSFAIGSNYIRPSTTRVGWTVGGGVEYGITHNWSARVEYRYADFGHSADTFPLILTHHDYEHLVRVGFSYKFDMYTPPAPIVAKY